MSPWASFTQVGRPWLHWPEWGVTSISRSKAFISETERRRPAPCSRRDPDAEVVAAIRADARGEDRLGLRRRRIARRRRVVEDVLPAGRALLRRLQVPDCVAHRAGFP